MNQLSQTKGLLWLFCLFTIGVLLVLGTHFFLNRTVIIAIGVIGLWRYSLQVVHIIRNVLYARQHKKTLIQNEPVSSVKNLIIVVADYKINNDVRVKVIDSIRDAINEVQTLVSVDLIFTSDEDVPKINNEFDGLKIKAHQLRQHNGKRAALADCLDYVKKLDIPINETVICLMDGDTALDTNTLQDTLHAFNTNANCGALTTNQRISLVDDNRFVEDWYRLKFSKRNHYMKSHALSKKVMTLTGRYSAFNGKVALTKDFISGLRDDSFKHWLYGKVKFLMGDDKSTCYKVQQQNMDMLYLPSTYVTNFDETEGQTFLGFSLAKMSRWYGNMVRNAPRTVKQGRKFLPPFIWYCYADQLISCFTTLIGPMAALILFSKFGISMLISYLGLVLLTRSLQLGVLASQGHIVRKYDLPLLLFDQWLGSFIKIFCIFFPQIQTFALRDNQSFFKQIENPLKYKLSYYLMVVTFFVQIISVYIILG